MRVVANGFGVAWITRGDFDSCHEPASNVETSYCSRSDCERLNKFWGATRIAPARGLSMSQIRKNAMDTTTGTIRNMPRFVRRAPYPINRLQHIAINTISPHA